MYLGDDPSSTDATAGTSLPAPSIGQSILNDVTQLVQGFTQFKLGQQQLNTAQTITQLNIQRAQQGLPPIVLDPSATGAPGISVGLSQGTQQLLMYGLLGAGVLMVANMLTKRR
jgi:hypothetical protein